MKTSIHSKNEERERERNKQRKKKRAIRKERLSEREGGIECV